MGSPQVELCRREKDGEPVPVAVVMLSLTLARPECVANGAVPSAPSAASLNAPSSTSLV